jgi:hypothetical protein
MKTNIKEILDGCLNNPNSNNELCSLVITAGFEINVYPKSVNKIWNSYIFLGKDSTGKALWVTEGDIENEFDGVKRNGVRRCLLSNLNAKVLRDFFDFTRPSLVGQRNSIGCGDRLGLANAGHIRAVAGSGLKPILAQQSVRELERTKREAEDVMDAAMWAVFQEGYKDGYGADADHLKTTEDIDRYAKAGFTMFTLDIGQYVVNEAARLPIEEIHKRAVVLPWDVLASTLDVTVQRYQSKLFEITKDFTIQPSEEGILRSFVKYGAGIAQTVTLVNHLKTKWHSQPFEIELSVDETDTPTSPLEHFIIANELKRLGIKLMSLAPRFIGDFEKGIEYKGDLNKFKEEYVKHVQIAEKLGPYKISIHSGSDKFDVYRVVGSIGFGNVHVKTAGTSWLEALRTVAASDSALFKEILNCACANYDNDRKSYHVTADTSKVHPAKDYTKVELLGLLSDDNARQILHVTFGTILSKKDENGRYSFKDNIIKCLQDHEDFHYQCLVKHFRRHIDPIIHPQNK